MTLEQKTEELRGVEQELAALQEDRDKLLTLRDKYGQDFASAETAWRQDRGQKQLDAMIRAKALTDTVKTALTDQEQEIARVQVYANVLRDEIRTETALSSLGSNQVARLAAVQGEFGSRLSALQEHLAAEMLALDALSVEWDRLHHESWGVIRDLGLSPQDAGRKLANQGVDVAPLRLVLLPPSDRERQEHYKLPLNLSTPTNEFQGWVTVNCGRLVVTALGVTEQERSERDWKMRQSEKARQRTQQLVGLQAGEEP